MFKNQTSSYIGKWIDRALHVEIIRMIDEEVMLNICGFDFQIVILYIVLDFLVQMPIHMSLFVKSNLI